MWVTLINSAEDILEIGFKTNIKNKMFWVEVIGLLSKTNITSNDNFHATIKLTNITKEGEYTILCGFNDYVKPVATGSDDIGVDDKKTIQIKYNKNNQPTAENSTITDNNTVPSNPDANKTSPQPVKTSLLLKPVSVKKSAKKLVLQIVLKQNKKVLKGKKITFIFNGKKYTAKTNKKGIAKVTIKKNILKKLKAGKKVKYQVKYGKTVSRETLIVNK